MAKVCNVLRTCGIFFFLIFKLCASANLNVEPWIVSFSIDSKSCDGLNCKYLLFVRGGEFLGHYSWRLTPNEGSRGGSCDVIYPNYEIKEIETKQWYTKVEVLVPVSTVKVYFCLHFPGQNKSPVGGIWAHQGSEIFLETAKELTQQKSQSENLQQSTKPAATTVSNNDADQGTITWTDLSHDIDVNYLPNTPRPTRQEREDIEVLIEDKYVPLKTVEEDDNTEEATTGPRFEILYKENGRYVKKDLDELGTTDESTKGPRFEIIYRDHSIIDMLAKPLYRKYADRYSDVETNDINKPDAETDFEDNPAFVKHKMVKREIISGNKGGSEAINDAFEVIDDNKAGVLEFSNQRKENYKEDLKMFTRNQRQAFGVPTDDFGVVRADVVPIALEGIRIEDSDKEPKIIDEGIPSVLADTKVVLRLFGQGLTTRTVIAFTHDPMEYGAPCKFLLKGEYMALPETVTANTALFEIWAPSPIAGSKLYICAKNLPLGVSDPDMDESKYFHQGTETYKMIATHNKLLPLWFSLILILICLMFSALFSGLNLGLMSLDRTELKIISNTGTEQERKYARTIMPVRDHGNYLLCSILLGNVAVNSTFTILLDDLTSGLFAVIFSTLAIVLLGEITPQAICSRHGLMVGAKSIMITKAVMALTAPLAFPVSKLLDYFLGEEIGNVYNRERLKELVKVTTGVNDLDKDEVNIISGALEMRKKTVFDVMTKLEDVFMLPITSILDFETMSEIIKSGYSRIPVYEGNRANIITVLFIKDLAFVDPDDNTPLRTLCQYYQNPCNFVFEDVTLDIMFKQFKEGHKGHMAFVHRVNNEGEGDPFYETIGLVTLEDVIEEMIQAEIVDETDVFMDNRTKRRRNRPQNKLQDFAAFAERHENQRIHISPQLTLATFQFLSTSVDAFRPDTVSETVLRRLLKQDVIHHIKLKGKTKKELSTYVYQQGKAVDYFVLILEGRVEVTVGRENLVFEAGPFTYFGVQALTQNIGVAESPTPSAMGSLQNINMDAMLRHTFVPDYSVRATTELYYLTVKRSLYLAAKRATLMEKGALSKGATNEQFDTEVDKLLQSVDEDISISGEHKTPSRQVSPNPVPASASPLTRASFTSRTSPEPRDSYTTRDEQEKLLK